MSVEIPVFLVNASGGRDADNVNCSPCIEVVVVGAGKAFKAVAMLDSGATAMYADPKLIEILKLPVIGTDTFHAVGYSGVTTIHSATFWIDDLPDLPVNLQESPLRSRGMPYDIILGRQFLTMFYFGFDPRNGAWRLVRLGASKADNSNRPTLQGS